MGLRTWQVLLGAPDGTKQTKQTKPDGVDLQIRVDGFFLFMKIKTTNNEGLQLSIYQFSKLQS